jgi:hypothetical protein
MQTVVVPLAVDSFQVICEECLAGAGKDGAVVSGSFEKDARVCVVLCPAGHKVEALKVEQGFSAATLIGHAA